MPLSIHIDIMPFAWLSIVSYSIKASSNDDGWLARKEFRVGLSFGAQSIGLIVGPLLVWVMVVCQVRQRV